eukprot:595894-Rhodomonas_salina.1
MALHEENKRDVIVGVDGQSHEGPSLAYVQKVPPPLSSYPAPLMCPVLTSGPTLCYTQYYYY